MVPRRECRSRHVHLLPPTFHLLMIVIVMVEVVIVIVIVMVEVVDYVWGPGSDQGRQTCLHLLEATT